MDFKSAMKLAAEKHHEEVLGLQRELQLLRKCLKLDSAKCQETMMSKGYVSTEPVHSEAEVQTQVGEENVFLEVETTARTLTSVQDANSFLEGQMQQCDDEVPLERHEFGSNGKSKTPTGSHEKYSTTEEEDSQTPTHPDLNRGQSGIAAVMLRAIWSGEGVEMSHSMSSRALGQRSMGSWRGESVNSSVIRATPHEVLGRCVLHPMGTKRVFWDCLTTCTLVYDVVMIPYLLAFDADMNQYLATAIFVLWIIDIWMSCITGYYKNEIMITSLKQIIKHYLRTWFLFDVLLVSVDLAIMLSGSMANAARLSRVGKFVRLFRFLRMLRIFRVVRAQHAFQYYLDQLLSEISRVRFKALRIVLLVVLINHFIACFWYAIGTSDANLQSWVHLQDTMEKSSFLRYLISLQWAITNFGVGGSRIYPMNEIENMFAILVMISSLIIFSTIVSSVTNSYSYIQQVQGSEERNIGQLNTFFIQHKVPKELCRRVQRHCLQIFKRSQTQMQLRNVALLDFASEQLKAELQHHIYKNFLEQHALLGSLCRSSKLMMHQVSSEAVLGINVAFGDTLFYRGMFAAKMFFLPRLGACDERYLAYSLKTQANEIMGPSVIAKKLPPGIWVSEVAMWTSNWLYSGHLRSTEDFCEVVVLDVLLFARIVARHPMMLGELKEHANHFVNKLRLDFDNAWAEELKLSSPVSEGDIESEIQLGAHGLQVMFADEVQKGANLVEICSAYYDFCCLDAEDHPESRRKSVRIKSIASFLPLGIK